MNARLLIRPGFRKKTDQHSEEFLPADLAASYACYHDNLAEQRKLEQKLHVIDVETKMMKRDFRQKRGILERELKQSENYYWNCHRVFSAASLITDSDSYRKHFYNGPQPTKAKLPRKKLARLGQLVRRLQAEEDLETLSNFQRCARYVRRKTAVDLASGLTPAEEDSFDSMQPQRLAETRSEHSAEGVNSRNASGRIKRIRSAPSRVVSGKTTQEEFNESPHSTCARKCSPKKLSETFRAKAKVKESSGVIHSDRREEPSIKFAWVEKEQEVQKIGIDGPPNESVVVQSRVRYDDLGETSREQQTVQNRIELSRDFQMLRTASKDRTSGESIGMNLSYQQQLRRESSFEKFQSNGDEIAEEDVKDSELFTGGEACIETHQVEEYRRRDEYSDQSAGSKGTNDETTPAAGTALIKIAYEYSKKQPSTPTSFDTVKNEDVQSQSKDKAKERKSKLDEEPSFRKHVEFQSEDAEISDLTRRKQHEEISEATANTSDGSGFHHGANGKAQRKRSEEVSIALPKSSLHGLSSHRKLLFPRTQHKLREKNARAFDKAPRDEQDVKDYSNRKSSVVKMLPENATNMRTNRPEEGTQRTKDVQKKRKPSIFKRKCLSEVLYSGQIQREGQLRDRVQGFLEEAGDTIEETGEETGEEKLTHVNIGVDCF